MNRSEQFQKLNASFDVLVIGGGATGLGIAVDAATRGYRTALVEGGDFAQATSSRATKLVHGGVRYLASGQIHLVYEALHERTVMMKNAPHLVQPLPFITPVYHWLDLPFYGSGLMLYDVLSGKSSMGPTKILGRKETIHKIPGIATKNLVGSVMYHDGQFDDARLALALALTAEDHGAVVLNYARCTRLLKANGKVTGAIIQDIETGAEATVYAKAVFNASGIFTDEMRQQDDPDRPKLLSVSRGTHIVVAPEVLGGMNAIMIPKTEDGRVIFAIPWLGKVVIGTTDIPASHPEMEPGYEESEIDYILEHINPYLETPIRHQDILAVFSGLRPLVTGNSSTTSKLSREHHIDISDSGMITIAGGKWTTYRRMAQDAIDYSIEHKLLEQMACRTKEVPLHGAPSLNAVKHDAIGRFGTYAPKIDELIAEDSTLGARIDPQLPFTLAEVVFSIRHEMARTLEDVLARRARALFLDVHAALRSAPVVANVMRRELNQSEEWEQDQLDRFRKLAMTFYMDTKAS